MPNEVSSPPSSLASRLGAPWRLGSAVLTIGALAVFTYYFDVQRNQLLLDGLWVAALALWAVTIVSAFPPPRFSSPGELPWRPLAAFLALFACAWLPFYDNWRWAYTGDSFSFWNWSYNLYDLGLRFNALGWAGSIDDIQTNLYHLAYNWWVFPFGPTMFAHRFGSFVMAAFGVGAIYTYFSLGLRSAAWALAIIFLTVTNYMWIWISYVSYERVDSFIFYYVALSCALLAWRSPERIGPWLLGGINTGLALFFTQVSWPGVVASGVVLSLVTLRTRRWQPFVIFIVSFLIAALPVLHEFRWWMRMLQYNAGPSHQTWHFTFSYFANIAQQMFWLPYTSSILRQGGNGAFLRWPFGSLYLAGCGLAALGLVGPVRRRLHIPGFATPLLLLLAWDIILQSLTTPGYGSPSHKRAYNLVPLEVFFAVLPFIVVSAWPSRVLRHGVVALFIAAVGAYAAENFQLLMFPTPGTYGENIYDGFIELRQRFPERAVVFLRSGDAVRELLAPGSRFDLAYHIADHLTVTPVFEESVVVRACGTGDVICYEPNADGVQAEPLLKSFADRLQPFPLLNSIQLACYECPQPR